MEDRIYEKQKILDEGFLTRSLIENEFAMKKCALYSEMASDATIKSFFKDQAKQLGDVQSYLQDGMSDLK